MLLLLFQVGQDSYGLEVSRIVEVGPMVAIKKIPHAPDYVAGHCNYRGTVVPVIDLSALLAGVTCRPLLSTRIIFWKTVGPDQRPLILGLLAEQVTEAIACREEDFQPAGVEVEGARYLGRILLHEKGMIRRIRVEQILSPSLQRLLFAGDERG